MTQQQILLLLLAIGAIAFIVMTRSSTPVTSMSQYTNHYINAESWDIERDPRGYIINVTVHRDAHTS